MNRSAHDAYERKLQEIAADYRARGYDVLIEPGPEDVPAFLTGVRPDLIARGPHDSIVVEMKKIRDRAGNAAFRRAAIASPSQP